MATMIKENDWIVANMNNPTFDVGDFQHISDMTLNNTQLLPKDLYLRSNYIRENDMFKNQRGEFSEDLFGKFYDGAVLKFAEFSTENIIDNYEYSMWDVMKPKKGKVKDVRFNLGTTLNPTHMSVGIAGFNEISESPKSLREWAQDSKIFDPATGKYLDYSVNDISFWNDPVAYFKSLFDDPLVYATYDQDTEEIDPITGNRVLHKKGEWKVNDEGEFYVEKLNGRSLMGKLVVSALDYLTPENSIINKYDFFDSDDVLKSVGGTIAKNVATILPMLIPYVRIAYSGLMVTREMSKSLPMLYGMFQGFSGSENIDNQFLNTMAAYGHRMSGGTSDYAQLNTFSFENFGNLMSDVALQWGQQKFIANTFSKLTGGGKRAMNTAYARALGEYMEQTKKGIAKVFNNEIPEAAFVQRTGISSPLAVGKEMKELIQSGKWMETAYGSAAVKKYIPAAQKAIENRMRLGLDMSLAYMAIISNTDVYESVLEHGGTPFEAAAIAFGSIVGMFSVDKYLGLGEMFFNEEPARKAIRQAARQNADLLMKTAGIKAEEAMTKKGIMGLIQKGINAGRKAVDDYHSAIKERTLGFFGKSLGEALEEVSEELVADLSKTMGEVAGRLGYFSLNDYGAWENMFDRYAMSFLGGAAGGGMFYGVEVVTNRHNKSTQDFQNDLIYLLREGKKGEIMLELDNLRSRGLLGSKDLAYNKTSEDTKGTPVALTAENESESQSDYVYNTLKNTINQLDMILNEEGLNLSDDELFDKMVQGEYRAMALTDFLRGDSRNLTPENIKNISYITRYQEDFQKLTNQIVDKEAEILAYINNTADLAKRNNESFKEGLDKLKAEKQKLIDRKEYLFGEGSLGYVRKMLFAIDTNLSGNFVSLTFDQFVRSNAGKSYENLTGAEKEAYAKAYEEYSKISKKTLDEAFDLFLEMLDRINPEIQKLQELDLTKDIEAFKKITENDPFSKYVDYNYKFEDESDEDYEDRYIKREGEEEKDFQARQEARRNKVKAYNQAHLNEWILELTKLPIDRNTFRTLQAKIGNLKKTARDRVIETLGIPGNSDLLYKIWNIMKTIGPNKNERDTLYKLIRQATYESTDEITTNEFRDRMNLEQWENMKNDLNAISNLDPEDKVAYGFDEDYEYDPNVPLTLGDVARYINATVTMQAQRGNIMSDEDIISWLESTGWDFSDSPQGIANQEALGFYYEVKNGLVSLADDRATEIVEITDQYLDKIINERTDLAVEQYKPLIEKVFKNLETDLDIEALDSLEKSAYLSNPALPVLKQITQKLRNSQIDIDQFLEEIHSQYLSGETAREFQLSSSLKKLLKEFKQDIAMAKAFIYAAYSSSDYTEPIGHNKQINQFVANHKNIYGNVNPLPEIDSKLAIFLMQELSKYDHEIDVWILRSETNVADKVQKFIDSEVAFNKARLNFYKINREAFKISPTLDLLEGYEDLSLDDSLKSLILVEELLHNNYKKHTKNGVTLETILDGILPNKLVNLESLKSLITAKLDENIEYKHLTDYDKFGILISNFALSSAKFYSKLKDFIVSNPNLAPLSIQEYAARLTQSQQHDSKTINAALRYLKKTLNLDFDILENTTIATGVGGSGKTFAVARLATENGLDTWVTGPDQSQVDNLLSSLPEAQGKSKEDLLKLALGEEEAIALLKDISSKATTSKFYTKVTGLDDNKTVVLKDTVNVKKLSKPPKFIVIDEATHFSTAELLVLSKFAAANNIQQILLGDTNQNGFASPGIMENLLREFVLGWRTPKLFISLRENNVQKINNLQSTISIMEQLLATSSKDEIVNLTQNLLDGEFKNFTFKYYNGETFYGEYITDSVPSDMLSKLNGSIGFIGSETSPHYQQLKDAGKNVSLVNPLAVQGREFIYVVVDKNWDFKVNSADLHETGVKLDEFMKDLYTMISRSQKGTILIDNGLSSLVKNVEDEFTGESSSVTEAAEQFRKARIKQIEEALAEIKVTEEEEKKDEKKTEDKKKADDKGKGEEKDSKKKEEPTGQDGKTVIKGTSTTLEELADEKEPVKLESELRNKEKTESEIQEEKSYTNMTTTARVYCNVHHSGIDTSQEVWSNPNDSTKDLGIFLRKGQQVLKKDRYKLVKKLIQLKCLLTFGTDKWANADVEVRRLFSRDVLDNPDNIEYYVSVADNFPENNLVGLTDKYKNGLSNNEESKLINGKVITLIAKIKGKLEGLVYTVTLGALANPATWKKNEQDIRKAIEARIANGDPDSAHLLEYLDNLSKNIQIYGDKIELLSRANQEYRINKPEFSRMTTLISAGENLRLENINSKFSPFDEATAYAVKSKIYAITTKEGENDIPGIDPKLSGRAVMYVSSNILLEPDLLEKEYMNQKENPDDPETIPQVRMIVLDNLGVSFASLYRKNYQEIYTINKDDVRYVTPFKLEPMAIRMYMSAWNFRANLKRFLLIYNEWVDNSDLSEGLIEDLCKLDNKLYSEIRGDRDYLSEEEYRGLVSEEMKQKLKPIWDFNDDLADSTKQFRLGYESKNGAYIRKITNLKEGGLYKDINNTLGIYINPSMARQFDKMLDALFKNVINKIIPTEYEPKDNNTLPPLMEDNLVEDWFQNVDNNKELTIKMYDDLGKELNNTLNISLEGALMKLPSAIIEAAKFLEIRGLGPVSFDEYLDEQGIKEEPDVRYFIQFGEEFLDWRSIAHALDGGQVETSDKGTFNEGTYPPGIRPNIVEGEGNDRAYYGVRDKRIDNMFNLMFHGMISTRYLNDFTRGDIRATDAKFKFGFFADPILLAKKNGVENQSAPVLTNRKLFSADVVPGFPIIGISLDPYEETKPKEPVKKEPEGPKVDLVLDLAKSESFNILKASSIDVSQKDLNNVTSMKELLDLVSSEINDKFVQYFENYDTLPLEKLIIGAKLNGNKIEFIYFPSSPELNGETIDTEKSGWQDLSMMIVTTSGKKYSVLRIDENLTWTAVTDPQPKGRTVGEIKGQIKEVLNNLSAFMDEDEIEPITRIMNEGFKNMQDSKEPSDTLIARVLNEIQESLQSLDDETDEEWHNALTNETGKLLEELDKINDALSNIKNDDCIV